MLETSGGTITREVLSGPATVVRITGGVVLVGGDLFHSTSMGTIPRGLRRPPLRHRPRDAGGDAAAREAVSSTPSRYR